jgi:flagellar hook protein FlgE
MFASFSTALSALDANATAVGIVGNNLANLDTPGYKDSVAYFQNLMSESLGTGTQVGFGVEQPLTMTQFTQGAIQSSGGPLDAAIQGDGFFVVNNGSVPEYTRAGSFQTDLSGNLLTPSGAYVQGWTATNGVLNTGGPIGNIVVPVGSMQAPVASTSFTLNANLNSSSNADATSAWSSPVTVYDSLGDAHVVTLNFQKTAANTWSYTATVPGADVSAGTAGTPYDIPGATGTLTFNSNGQLTSPAAGSPITIAIPGLSDGAADMNLSWSPYNADGSGSITQFDETSAASANSQNGLAAAQLTGVAMGNGGQLIASYSNGQQTVVGQLAMASIRNPQSLLSVGNNDYQVSSTTAAPSIGVPGTGGRGTVTGGSLEASNVDIATEFTQLIVLQSAYQADSKVITTVSDMAQETTSLISS